MSDAFVGPTANSISGIVAGWATLNVLERSLECPPRRRRALTVTRSPGVKGVWGTKLAPVADA
jgi:hypothetical protein